jgi:hypothetical protein
VTAELFQWIKVQIVYLLRNGRSNAMAKIRDNFNGLPLEVLALIVQISFSVFQPEQKSVNKRKFYFSNYNAFILSPHSLSRSSTYNNKGTVAVQSQQQCD